MMNIVVCVKEILDPEIPSKVFQIDPNIKRAIQPPGIELLISDYDESAVEAALRIKDTEDAKVTVVSLGEESTIKVIKRCLAMGADEGILVKRAHQVDESDGFSTAFILSEAIKKLDKFDLILCGVQEGDWDGGQVGSGIAEFLNIPSVTMVARIDVHGNKALVERVVADGRETVEAPLPALLTVRSEIGEPRYPSLRRVMQVSKKEIPVWDSQDMAIPRAMNKILDLIIPHHEAKCEFIQAESSEEAGVNLALKLREARLV